MHKMRGHTFKEVCDFIAKAKILVKKDTNEYLTSSEIFNYSPTGELYMIWEWFEEAQLAPGGPFNDKNGNLSDSKY